jgi:ATP-dependent Lon protease
MSAPEKLLTLPVVPIKNTVLFPALVMPLSIGRAASVAAVEAALARDDKTLVIVAQRSDAVEEPAQNDLYGVGTRAVIKKMGRADNAVQLIVQGIERVAIVAFESGPGGQRASVRPLPMPEDHGIEIEALHRALVDLAGQIQSMLQPPPPVDVAQMVSQVTEPIFAVYLLASLLALDADKAQAILEAGTRLDALQLMHAHMSHEVEVLKLRNKIASEAETEIGKEQREYMLRQQLRAIQQELGEENPEQAEVNELRDRLNKAELPADVRKEAERELNRLTNLHPAAPDYQLTRTYVEFVLELPWTKTTEDILDLGRARQILDEDHYDLKEVKERILEQLAVLKLNPQAKAPILCFVGPPGTGKTSLGQSIARALGRKFERMSLGGLHDEAELRGHRRTYIGAMPGRIVQAIRRAGVRNPLIMLDEVDKLGRDFRGDPAAALMEILDPAQNTTFRDNYLDLPFDLSKVFFITTANTLDTVPQPLLDRMETLRLAGYTDAEKIQIARRYLIPRQRGESGLTAEQLTIPDDTLTHIITRYTREAGLRQLERGIGRLARKVAVRFAEGKTQPVTVQPQDLPEMLGPERFFLERARKTLPPGVATGLAWTEAGGDVLYVEAILLPGMREMTLTGQLGEVMQESAKAALSYVWSQAPELGIEQPAIRRSGVHIHVPAGATPKDGPSAGVAMATALASLYTNRPARADTAMTGEITLTGLVLPVGGIKEKVLAARRAGIRRVILPRDNDKDLHDLPPGVADEVEFVLAEHIDDVLSAAIPGIAERLSPTTPPALVPASGQAAPLLGGHRAGGESPHALV